MIVTIITVMIHVNMLITTITHIVLITVNHWDEDPAATASGNGEKVKAAADTTSAIKPADPAPAEEEVDVEKEEQEVFFYVGNHINAVNT